VTGVQTCALPIYDYWIFPTLPVPSSGLVREERPFKMIMQRSIDALNADVRGKVVDSRREDVHEAAQQVDMCMRFRLELQRLSGSKVRVENRANYRNCGSHCRESPEANHKPPIKNILNVPHFMQIGARKLPSRRVLMYLAPIGTENEKRGRVLRRLEASGLYCRTLVVAKYT